MFTPGTRNPRRAIVMILMATSLFAATTVIAKFLGTKTAPLHPLQISAGRFFFGFLVILAYTIITRPKIHTTIFPLHIFRSIAGWAGVSLMFAAATLIPLSDATAISFLNPVFGMMLAIPLLGEKVGKWRWFSAAIALIGAVILLRPSANSFQPAALLALGAAMMMGLEVTLIKLLSNRESPLQILLINNACGATIACIAAYFVWVSPSIAQWIGLIAIGCVMVTAQTLFIQAMRSAEASYVLPFSYATLIFATLYDFLIFSVRPDVVTIIGATIIIAGALLLAWRENIKRAEKVQ